MIIMIPYALQVRKERLDSLASTEFDVLVIGAGITGAGIAWDAALRGLKVAIIDKEDFGAGTSSGSSKLVHAGIRYLAYGEFSLVRHASRERMWMFKHCPHQTEPIPFLIPIYKKGKNSFLKLLFAGVMYDILALFQNTKNHKFLSKRKTQEKVPNLKSDTLKRSLYYYDGVMDDARVTLETILAARDNGALCVNHLEVVDIELDKESNGEDVIKSVEVEDKLVGNKFRIKAKTYVNATGPWTDQFLKKISYPKKILRTTKGIHIITKRLVKENTVVVITAEDDRGMFVIPFRKDYSLIGTTDTYYNEDYDHVKVTQEDIDYVVSAVNNDFPNIITKKDVISAYSGVRPLLISPKAKSETDTSRGFDIIQTNPHFFTITGGKYTIFRHMAEKMVNKIVKILKLKKQDYKCKTKTSYLHGGEGISNIDDYIQANKPIVVKNYKIDDDIAEHIIRTYGNNHRKVLKLIDENKKLAERIGKNRPHILAEVHYAIKEEICFTMSDFMLRRTQLQLIDNQGLDCIEKISKEMAPLLNWDEKERMKQIEEYKNNLVWK